MVSQYIRDTSDVVMVILAGVGAIWCLMISFLDVRKEYATLKVAKKRRKK